MTEPRNHLTRDLKAVRYLDALNAGDLDAVATLWEEASRDPELERILAELDGALFVENSTAMGNASAPTRQRGIWTGLVGTLTAACLLALALFAWSRRDGKAPEPGPATNNSAPQVIPRAPDEFAALLWPEGRRVVNGAETQTFHWPLPNTSPNNLSTSIPTELLE
jgi:hypothetical protein